MTSMGWQTTGDVTEFLAAAGPYLRKERARNTVILTVTEAMRAGSAGAAREGDPAARLARPHCRAGRATSPCNCI